MVRMMFVALVALAAVVFDRQPAAAYEAPWCAVLNMGKGAYWDCQYRSIEECRPVVLSGSRGWCNPNPFCCRACRTQEGAEIPRARAVGTPAQQLSRGNGSVPGMSLLRRVSMGAVNRAGVPAISCRRARPSLSAPQVRRPASPATI